VKSARWSVLGGRVALTCLALSPMAAGLTFADHWLDWGWESHGAMSALALKLLPVLLPLTAAVVMSVAKTLDHNRRALRYPNMVERLERLEREVPANGSDTRLRD